MTAAEGAPGSDGGTAGRHAWDLPGIWAGVLAVSVLLPAGYVLLGEGGTVENAFVAGLLVAILPIFAVVGRPAIRSRATWRLVLYLGLLVLVYAPAVYLNSASYFALFGLYPQCFIALRYGRAVFAAAALSLSPVLVFVLNGADAGTALALLVGAGIQIVFSAGFGFWISRIITQSGERAQLIEELENSRAEIARLSAERGALAERERLAGEIHDTLAQGFTSIIMLIQAAQAQPDPARHLELAVRTARENLAEARALIEALAPAPLDGSSLEEALGRLTVRLGEETGVRADFDTAGTSRPLPPPVEVVLIRAAQEGLSNVRKHAGASRTTVELEYGGHEVALRIRDDGNGLHPANGGGYGLRAMRGRVEQAGGLVRVDGDPGKGTTLEIVIPDREM
ncbi:two-component sensor histidine kinase [Microtetraspora sp. NBRC 13810]|nr:two-component sensor histidine kinase [Microtetraspora sp. NBRC 13810]